MSQASFQKQQRERARKEKAALKAARKEERRAEAGTDETPTTATDEAKVLDALAALHARFEAGGMTFEDFEAARDELIARLAV
jgi:hypothetical protein